MADFELEKEFLNKGFVPVGVDEAGRGPLAGSVYAAAVILPADFDANGITDSKKLSHKKRELLFDYIVQNCVAHGIASVSAKEIDEINIRNAAFLAMRRAVEAMNYSGNLHLLIDGNGFNDFGVPYTTIIKGDAKSVTIAAASILAKVSRDREMSKMDEIYPEYGFAKHKGYGTKAHYEAIAKHGICPIHRKSFRLN